jgi:hypothetical protein
MRRGRGPKRPKRASANSRRLDRCDSEYLSTLRQQLKKLETVVAEFEESA